MSALAVGYFDAPEQAMPAHDPGLDVDCPVCTLPLERKTKPIKTISVMAEGSGRSCFYRVHKSCYEGLTEREQTAFDAVAMGEAKAACREEAE